MIWLLTKFVIWDLCFCCGHYTIRSSHDNAAKGIMVVLDIKSHIICRLSNGVIGHLLFFPASHLTAVFITQGSSYVIHQRGTGWSFWRSPLVKVSPWKGRADCLICFLITQSQDVICFRIKRYLLDFSHNAIMLLTCSLPYLSWVLLIEYTRCSRKWCICISPIILCCNGCNFTCSHFTCECL